MGRAIGTISLRIALMNFSSSACIKRLVACLAKRIESRVLVYSFSIAVVSPQMFQQKLTTIPFLQLHILHDRVCTDCVSL
jgi:hypothetical protein